MSIETGRAYLRARGYEDRIQEFSVSSATVELAAQAVGCEPAPHRQDPLLCGGRGLRAHRLRRGRQD